MCGILGGWWSDHPSKLDVRLHQGLDLLQHRGPNDRGLTKLPAAGGLLALGHTRLSILDLSPAGRQPRTSTDGRYTLSFNGEIYNYRELRERLSTLGRHFVTDTDTEVLLAAWQTWGVDALPRLVGMFAFAVFDAHSQTLTCAVDPFGIKPLFWRMDSGNLSFASEQRAVHAVAGQAARLDWQSSNDYLVHGVYDDGARTFLAGTHRLRAGHLMHWTPGSGMQPVISAWWHPPLHAEETLSFSHATEQFRALFLDSIKLHLRSDVPVGAALSGGLDSSAIVCAIRHLEPNLPLHTVSFIAPGSPQSEAAWANIVTQHVGAQTTLVEARPGDLAAHLDDLIQAQGEPFGSTSIYAQYRVFQAAREQGLTVMLEGQGADELLAGYQGYPAYRMQSLIETGRWLEACRFARSWSAWPGRSMSHLIRHTASLFLDDDIYHKLRHLIGKPLRPEWLDQAMMEDAGVRAEFPRPADGSARRGSRVLQKLGASLSDRGLPALLRQGDRNAMRFSIENRVPFLTTPLAQRLLTMPEQYLISPSGETKSVLRAALRGIVPDEILNRRDKVGFVTPELDWLRALGPQTRDWILQASAVPFLAPTSMLQTFDAMMAGKQPFTWQVWRWINFIRWYQLENIQN